LLRGIIGLCQNPDEEAARFACSALAGISEDLSTHDAITKCGGGSFMIGLIHHEGVDVHREASRALANLMSSFDTHPDVIAAALPGLVVLA